MELTKLKIWIKFYLNKFYLKFIVNFFAAYRAVWMRNRMCRLPRTPDPLPGQGHQHSSPGGEGVPVGPFLEDTVGHSVWPSPTSMGRGYWWVDCGSPIRRSNCGKSRGKTALVELQFGRQINHRWSFRYAFNARFFVCVVDFFEVSDREPVAFLF